MVRQIFKSPIRLILRPRTEIDILEPFDHDTPDARHAWLGRIIARREIGFHLRKLLSTTWIRGSERVVQRAVEESCVVRSRVRSDEMQFSLNGGAEVVEIEIIQVVIEWVFDFLADLKESEEEKRRKGCTGDGGPEELRVNLELKRLKN